MTKAEADKIYMPIPVAPGYGINGKREVINLKTGRKIKKRRREKRRELVDFSWEGKRIIRSVENLYWQALEAYKGTQVYWKAIPSLNYKYEITLDGEVRNAATKKPLKLIRRGNCVQVRVTVAGQRFYRLLRELMSEVYHYNYRRRCRRIAVQLSRGDERHHFSSIKKCAMFLSKKFYYSVSWVKQKLCKRAPEVYGYAVKYF